MLCCNAWAQPNADTLQRTSQLLLQQGDFVHAIQALDKALELKPNDLSLLQDKAYAYYLQRDYAHGIEIAKPLIKRPDADLKSYQILGMIYKSVADYKECEKLYKAALNKFPSSSSVIYSEYGDLMLMWKKPEKAIKLWEKGIQENPNYSGNYYYATSYYYNNDNLLWAMLYAENFLNMESFSTRTIEIKDIFWNTIQKLFHENALHRYLERSDFEKQVAAILQKSLPSNEEDSAPFTVEDVIVTRTNFILSWYEANAAQFPYRLFEHQKYLLQEGMFEAYNQWLLGASVNTKSFQQWVQKHATEMKNFQNFQRSVLYKIPQGQYYSH